MCSVRVLSQTAILCFTLVCSAHAAEAVPQEIHCQLDDGYRGLWYSNQPSGDEYKFKYSGGLATYPQQHVPIAYYAKEANKTFFVYGGMARDALEPKHKRSLLVTVSYYDHATGQVPRPRILLDKHTEDAHDNPVIMLDAKGFIWIFAPAHGTSRPAYIFRSKRPHDIDDFTLIKELNFSYPEPWFLDPFGFVFLHTHYVKGNRQLYSMTSSDGQEWSNPRLLSAVEMGHYQISWRHGGTLATAFNFHPTPQGLNARTNLYYMQTKDGAKTWQTAGGEPLSPPFDKPNNPALIRDYRAEHLLVYLKDLNFDAAGHPIILYLTSHGYRSGPEDGPRTWMTARWTGDKWDYRELTTSDHNYDTGCLHVENDGRWLIYAPTTTGPQAYNPGGEVVLWTSSDQGASWTPRPLTAASRYNQTYMRRPVNANPGLYAIWADGDTRQPSACRLYFTTREGKVFRLPESMSGDTQSPEPILSETGPASR